MLRCAAYPHNCFGFKINGAKMCSQCTTLPYVDKCIEYIESCGWRFQYYNRPWYVFRSEKGTTWAGNHEITFTLKEMREVYKNGW